MKTRIGLVVLVVVCFVLAFVLFADRRKAEEQQHRDVVVIQGLSNDVSKANSDLKEEQQVAKDLEANVATEKQHIEAAEKAITDLTNNFTQVSANLAKSETALKTSQEENKQKEAKIADLEAQNQSLDRRALELTNAITSLTEQIEATKQKLAGAEGDKAYLQKELNRLVAEQEDLKRQFNDVAAVKAQLSKLRTEIGISHRLEMMRSGVYARDDMKGGQLQMQGFAQAPAAPKSNYDLNVEVNSDGSVHVIPPLKGTNSPPSK
jgi:chromosome segregation ATPase